MRKALTLILLTLILSLSMIAESSALKATTKECVFLMLGDSRAKKILSGSLMKLSEKSKVSKCEARARKFPKSSYIQFSEDYNLNRSYLKQIRSSYLFGSYGQKTAMQALNEEVLKRYPGLNGHLSSTVTPRKFVKYYSDAVEYALELIPSGSILWDDPLMINWLSNGFPITKSDLATALTEDSRYQYTARANAYARALGLAFACSFGSDEACDSYPAAEAAYESFGPLVR